MSIASDRPLVALAAGGTGGHLFPAQAVASALRARGIDTLLLTDTRGAAFAEAIADLPYVTLPAAHLGGGIVAKLRAGSTIATAIWRACGILRQRKARLVIGFGGYPSFAPVLAGRLLGLPILLQEQGTKFSLANAKLLRFADRIALSFPFEHPAAGGRRATVTGAPVRDAVRAAAGSPYPPLDGALNLLVVGGSQGASIFGETVPAALCRLPDAIRLRLHVALQYRGDDGERIRAELAAHGVTAEIAPFFDDMATRLARAHLVLCRAGASTAADLTTVGRPAIFVPIPVGGSADEQLRNAQAFEAQGAGWLLRQQDLASDLTPLLARLFSGEELPRAAGASAALGRPDGAARIAEIVIDMLGG